MAETTIPKTRIADLPDTSEINPRSYVIIERPGVGQGTYKATVGDLQEAITVHANVVQEEDITTITIKDINGTTSGEIVSPTASVTQEDVTTTITIHDYKGTTQEQIVTPVGTVVQEEDKTTITITDKNGTTSESIITPTAKIEQSGVNTDITIHDYKGTTTGRIIAPTAKIVDNGDNTATITITDMYGETHDTIVSRVILDQEPIEDSPNFLTSGSIYIVKKELEERSSGDEEQIEELRQQLAALEARLSDNEIATARSLTIEDNQEVPDPFIIDGVRYDNVADAILAAADHGGTVRLISNATNSGIAVPENSNFTLDLNGHSLTMTGPGSGSPGTQTLGMQLLKGTDVTIKNGTIIFDSDPRIKMGIQNYSNLTLDNVQVSGGSNITYVVSNNFGNVVFKNGTTITAATGRVAFDCWYGMQAAYDDGVNITIEDETVQINGKVEFGKHRRASAELFAQNASITCPFRMMLDMVYLNEPVMWYDNGDGSKTLRYVYQG